MTAVIDPFAAISNVKRVQHLPASPQTTHVCVVCGPSIELDESQRDAVKLVSEWLERRIAALMLDAADLRAGIAVDR